MTEKIYGDTVFYQLIYTERLNPNRYENAEYLVSTHRYDPYTTIGGCRRMYTKLRKSWEESNERAKLEGKEPYILSISARIEVCSWEPHMDLPTHDFTA